MNGADEEILPRDVVQRVVAVVLDVQAVHVRGDQAVTAVLRHVAASAGFIATAFSTSSGLPFAS